MNVDQQRLWAPWRLGYVTGSENSSSDSSPLPPEPSDWQPGAEPDCFLCRSAASYEQAEAAQRQNLVVDRGEHTVSLLNRYPYSNGHLLVSPWRHVGQLHELTAAEHLEAMQTLGRFTQRLSELMSATGFNVGLNLGEVAGAGVPGHLHWHLVPRWAGDNNFMPALASTRVLPQSLDALWEALTQ